eukprot:TRINITY_DN32827_c0_g1_i3.p1 TRINITY_DN32827_c0_g1~~TRINITY_DN32827_c0_g1_i3.p1  ORF type:complete len:120 (-),score=12.13 TRINITY_DN32827_c0_g1_i3:90-449(-)
MRGACYGRVCPIWAALLWAACPCVEAADSGCFDARYPADICCVKKTILNICWNRRFEGLEYIADPKQTGRKLRDYCCDAQATDAANDAQKRWNMWLKLKLPGLGRQCGAFDAKEDSHVA